MNFNWVAKLPNIDLVRERDNFKAAIGPLPAANSASIHPFGEIKRLQETIKEPEPEIVVNLFLNRTGL